MVAGLVTQGTVAAPGIMAPLGTRLNAAPKLSTILPTCDVKHIPILLHNNANTEHNTYNSFSFNEIQTKCSFTLLIYGKC